MVEMVERYPILGNLPTIQGTGISCLYPTHKTRVSHSSAQQSINTKTLTLNPGR